jgi:hypothetical protein
VGLGAASGRVGAAAVGGLGAAAAGRACGFGLKSVVAVLVHPLECFVVERFEEGIEVVAEFGDAVIGLFT